MTTQVIVMACEGRPRLLRATLERLVDPDGGALLRVPLVRPPRVYFAHTPERGQPLPDVAGFDVVPWPPGRPILPMFIGALMEADPTADLLLFEDDVWACARAAPLFAELEVPADVGVVSGFDFRNETTAPGLFVNPQGRNLWGAQALRIVAPLVERMQQLVTIGAHHFAGVIAWDTWIGFVAEQLGYRVATLAPSIVQHLGTRRSLGARDQVRPIANNFPERYPEVLEEDDVNWCSLHGVNHPGGNYCPARLPNN